MTYSEAMGSYEAEFLENILDTTYKYGVPYIIDREKYEAVMKEFGKEVRIKDADVVIFHANKDEEDGDIYNYTFFVFPKNSPDGSEDFYDCFQFGDYDYDYKHKEKFEEFVHAILESVVGVDVPTTMNLRDEKTKELRYAFKELNELDNIIQSQIPHDLTAGVVRDKKFSELKAGDSVWIWWVNELYEYSVQNIRHTKCFMLTNDGEKELEPNGDMHLTLNDGCAYYLTKDCADSEAVIWGMDGWHEYKIFGTSKEAVKSLLQAQLIADAKTLEDETEKWLKEFDK